ncbi:unnamed protein product, partial [Prorocentrum cordatum]
SMSHKPQRRLVEPSVVALHRARTLRHRLQARPAPSAVPRGPAPPSPTAARMRSALARAAASSPTPGRRATRPPSGATLAAR